MTHFLGAKSKAVFFLSTVVFSTVLTSTNAFAQAVAAGESIQQVVCPTDDNASASIYVARLDQPWFNANAYEVVKVFQGWGENEITKTIDGKSTKLVRIQFVNRGEAAEDAFIPKTEVMSLGECQTKRNEVPAARLEAVLAEEPDDDEDDKDDELSAEWPRISRLDEMKAELRRGPGLNSPNCCLFPLATNSKSYHSGAAKFGWSRGRGRRHAAADIYSARNAPVRAVTNGVMIRGPYKFYQGTYAVEVLHSGGFVVRYGEILGTSFVPVGNSVNRAQQVGAVGKTRCCTPMLHFELYTGRSEGRLRQDSNAPYRRRADLINPTSYLDKWKTK